MKENRKIINWANFKEGDIIIDLNGGKAMVLERLNNVIAKSGWYRFDAFGELVSIADCKRRGYRFIQPGNKIPMLQEEIEQYMGNIEIITKKKAKEYL